jgi:hypothetical protein
MMRIIPRGDDTYLFRDGGHASVGWLRGQTVRFTGFPSRRDTIAAAVQGTLAVTAYVRGTTLHAGPAIARPPDGADRCRAVAGESGGVWLKHEGGHEWVFIDGSTVARLVSPRDGEFSLEFVLSAEVSADARLTLAQMLYAAVRHHRTRPIGRSTTQHAAGVV